MPLKWQGRLSLMHAGTSYHARTKHSSPTALPNMRKGGQSCETRQHDKLAICQVSCSSNAWSCQHIDPFPDPVSRVSTPHPQHKIRPPQLCAFLPNVITLHYTFCFRCPISRFSSFIPKDFAITQPSLVS